MGLCAYVNSVTTVYIKVLWFFITLFKMCLYILCGSVSWWHSYHCSLVTATHRSTSVAQVLERALEPHRWY